MPLLVIIPVVGIALIYILETKVLLPDLARELVAHAALAAKLVEERPNLWDSPSQAKVFVDQISSDLTLRTMLYDAQGRLLASSDPADADHLGERLVSPTLTGALAGETEVRTIYSQQLRAEIADVWLPVLDSERQVAGVIRLSHRLAGVQEQFLRLRYLIFGVLLAAMVLGAAVGLLLALNIERPLRRVTRAIYDLASGQKATPLAEQGPAEIRLLLRAVNSLVEQLHSLEEARRKLLANLVHELGRPLGALRSAIQTLLGGADEDAELRRELLAGMEEETGRLRRLLEDLAQLHGQVLGTLELERRPVNISQWLPRLLTTWREEAQQKGIQWQANVPPNLPAVEADPDRLGQALGNLLSNAIKYTAPDGTVSLEANVDNGSLWIRVTDTGPGMSPEEQAHIFTPFYRGRTSTRFPQGMGLGLTIARDLVTAHGGRLDVESSPGSGSCFTIWMPLPPD